MSEPFDRILASTDPKLPGWRLHVSAETDDDAPIEEFQLCEEIVLPEQVQNPEARAIRRRASIILVRHEVEWLHRVLAEALAARGGPT